MATETRPVVPFLKYSLTIQPLTAVQIGTDETVAPYEYDIELMESGKYGILTVYDLNRLLSGLSSPQRTEFLQVSDSLDMKALRRWLRKTADPEKHRRFRVAMAWDAARDLHDSLDDLNREGLIHLQLRNAANQHPVIPGSSIKGAIRTAVIDRLLREGGDRNSQVRDEAIGRGGNSGARMEGALMDYNGNLRRDPFRQLAIGDAIFDLGTTCIERIEAVRSDGKPPKEDGIRIYREVLMGMAYVQQNHTAVADLRLSPCLADRQCLNPQFNPRTNRDEDIHLPIAFSTEQLIADCNRFYQTMCLEECESFRTSKSTSFSSAEHVAKVMQSVERLPPGQCIIRLGHHSHFDAVTVHGDLRQPPAKYNGRIRWFAGGYIPLGWAILTIDPCP
jgi:CRISPR-associated protein Csm5